MVRFFLNWDDYFPSYPSSFGWVDEITLIVWHFTGRGTAHYESWYGILRVMVRRVSISFSTQRHGDTEESILSVLIRAIRAKKNGR